MNTALRFISSLSIVTACFGTFAACSASGGVGTQNRSDGGVSAGGSGGSGASSGSGGFGASTGDECGTCNGTTYVSCESGSPEKMPCPQSCTPGEGCTACSPAGTICVGNEVHQCSDGVAGDLVQACDTAAGEVCSNGECINACALAEEQPSNLGCEFYAVDLDLSDGVTNPGANPWAVVLSNAGQVPADVVVETTNSPFGQAPDPTAIYSVTVQPGELVEYQMPTREVDCSVNPGEWNAPGTCISRNAFRIRSTAPIVVYQFNNNVHGFSTDASLLLPTHALGTKYRVTGWPVSHAAPSLGPFVQRSYVTIVGTVSGTTVKVKPSWRLRGNGNIPATAAGETLTATLGPFDVLNLESDDATLQECITMISPFCADLTGTGIESSHPVAVFSGTEQSGVGLPDDAPKPPSWDENSTGCCNQHLEEQLSPVESFGKKFLITRSPIRSDGQFTKWVEPDILRFVGAAEPAQITTTLPPPLNSFTLQPGEVKDTWTRDDVIVESSHPITVAQFLVGQGYVEPKPKGDPSFTIFPPVEQARTEYVFLSPADWKENWVVIGTEVGNDVSIDGAIPNDCIIAPIGELDGKQYEARRCPLQPGAHQMSGSRPFQVMAYGYATADAYAFAGGANIKKIYEPPTIF